jgi:uncharacterized membrane protein YadS
MSLVSVTRWEDQETGEGETRTAETSEVRGVILPGELWRRFPKFILGFMVASLVMTLATRSSSLSDYNRLAGPALLAPLTALRGWLFTFSFLSIGLSTRLGSFHHVTGNAFLAFSVGVVVNVVLGFLLSAVIFESYWSSLAL